MRDMGEDVKHMPCMCEDPQRQMTPQGQQGGVLQ